MRTVLLAAVLACGCTASSARRPDPSSTSPLENHAAAWAAGGGDEDAVRLAVFRDLMGHNASGGQPKVPFICLEVYEHDQARDPSPFILTAMRGSWPRVVPASACETDPGGVFLKDDHARGRGFVLRTQDVHINGDRATVTGGYFEASLSASGNFYILKRQRDGSWLV